MPWIIGGAVLGSAILGSSASRRAASTAAGATERATEASADVQRELFERSAELQEPWRKAGINALAQMETARTGMPPAFTGQVDVTRDPGYAFRMSEGMKALERSAAARGNLLSGGTLRGIQRYGQDLASQEYQNAYNRALTEYNAATQREATGYNRLAALAGIGQTTSQALGTQASNLGANLGQTYMTGGMGAGQARASGYLGQANALSNALGTGLNYFQGQQLMNRIFPSRSLGAGSPQYTYGEGYIPYGTSYGE